MKNHEEILVDLAPRNSNILTEVLVGLSKSQKSIPPKFLYDKKGSEIFEEICKTEDYYPTRTENKILQSAASEISSFIGPEALIIEPGSGNGDKARYLFQKLERPAGYVPMEISKEILLRMSEEFREEFESLKVFSVCADFTQDLEIPLEVNHLGQKKVIFFPGSTIGNLTPQEALQLLKKFGKMVGQGGGLLIGVDLKKESEIFEKAYDDSEGVTAEFNLNLLERLNRETEASFELENFSHEAFYNEELGRVEMHLVSKVPQLVRVHETVFRFHEGETIHTESSYKYNIDEFCELSAKAKFKLQKHWQDEDNLFCVYYFEKE